MKMTCLSNVSEEPEAAPTITALRATRASRSKIARLPAAVREELNQRLADGQEPAAILEWINDLPETRAIVNAQFQGQPINEDNISRWRKTGYAGWMEKEETRDAVEVMGAASGGFKKDTREVLSERIALIVTARLAMEVRNFGAMPEGEAKRAAWKELLWSLVLLRRSDFYADKLRLERDKMEFLQSARQQETPAAEEPMSLEEKQLRMEEILGTGRFEMRWDNDAKRMVGPGAAEYYEEEAIRTRLRQEVEERKKAGTWPSEKGVL